MEGKTEIDTQAWQLKASVQSDTHHFCVYFLGQRKYTAMPNLKVVESIILPGEQDSSGQESCLTYANQQAVSKPQHSSKPWLFMSSLSVIQNKAPQDAN